jgi:hypothetical protein
MHWSKIYQSRDGRRKETIPWVRSQLKFWYCYCGGRRGWRKLFNAVDAAEHLRVGLNARGQSEAIFEQLIAPWRERAAQLRNDPISAT